MTSREIELLTKAAKLGSVDWHGFSKAELNSAIRKAEREAKGKRSNRRSRRFKKARH